MEGIQATKTGNRQLRQSVSGRHLVLRFPLSEFILLSGYRNFEEADNNRVKVETESAEQEIECRR